VQMSTKSPHPRGSLERLHEQLSRLKPTDKAYVYTVDRDIIEVLKPGARKVRVATLHGGHDLEERIAVQLGGGRWNVIVVNAQNKAVATLRIFTCGPSLLRLAFERIAKA